MSANTARNVAADIKREKDFASEYREETEELDPENITSVTLEHHTVDIHYHTRKGTKTVRCRSATGPTSYNDIQEGSYSFYFEGRNYTYNPEDKRLISVGSEQDTIVAEGDEIYKTELVNFPTRAVVEGAIDSEAEATIYYRSPHSDEMQSVTVEVSYMEGQAAEINGKEVGTGRRIRARTRWERDIVSKHGTSERTLGKVTRVEFPKGHRFTVEVEGIDEGKAGERGEDRIAKYVKKAFRHSDSVEVTHEGELEWE